MILEPAEAQAFIAGYQAILLMLTAHHDTTSRRGFLASLIDGRQVLAQEPSAIEVALDKLEDKGVHVEPCVEHAVRTLRLGKWIYIRDTRYYSVFLDSESDSAFAVVGLTDRLRDLFGGSGVYVETGVVEYAGHYVCDGLFRTLASLGPNYRHSFNESYAAIRDAGRFQRRPEARLFE
ncbi:MAG TPA: hypothetical protein VMR74_11415 [Gammaproteobacteria bacterium]|nr:hypothetical protein [Gammaproteobacteria bacterium]